MSDIPLKHCNACNHDYPATTEYFYRVGLNGLMSKCIKCRLAQNAEYNRTRRIPNDDNARRRMQWHRDHPDTPGICYTVIDDPDPVGGFRKGAQIPTTHVKLMLNSACFSVGTVLKSRSCSYRVMGEKAPQRLVECVV